MADVLFWTFVVLLCILLAVFVVMFVAMTIVTIKDMWEEIWR
jgi:hypothetical protein